MLFDYPIDQRVSGGAITCCLIITGGYFLGIEEEGLGGKSEGFISGFSV